MKLAWGLKLDPIERTKVIDVARLIGVDPSHLMADMWFESRLDPAAVNPYSGASGIIQFMPRTALGLGTTIEAIRKMTFLQQMEYVLLYFRPYAGRVGTLEDSYMAILMPSAIGKPLNHALIKRDDGNGKAYIQNKGLDLNQDGTITKAEAARFVVKALQDGWAFASDDSRVIVRKPAIAKQEEEKDMDPFTGISLVGGLVNRVLEVFSPVVRAKVEEVAGKVAKNDDKEQLANNLMDLFQKVTGTLDPVQATAALTAKTPEAKVLVEKAETETMTTLDKLIPYFDKINEYERQARQDTEASRDKAAARAAATKQGSINLQPVQVKFTQKALAFAAIVNPVLILLLAVIARDELKDIILQLVGLEIFVVTMLANTFRDQNGYSFGGTYDSNANAAARAEMDRRASNDQRRFDKE